MGHSRPRMFVSDSTQAPGADGAAQLSVPKNLPANVGLITATIPCSSDAWFASHAVVRSGVVVKNQCDRHKQFGYSPTWRDSPVRTACYHLAAAYTRTLIDYCKLRTGD